MQGERSASPVCHAGSGTDNGPWPGSPKTVTNPPVFRTGLGASRPWRIDGLIFRRREILAERKLCPCLCHLTKS